MIADFLAKNSDVLSLWSVRLLFSLSLLWLAAALVAWFLRRSSAALRHRAWALSVLAALLLPLPLLALPEFRLGWMPIPVAAPETVRTTQRAKPAKKTPAVVASIPDTIAPQTRLDLPRGQAEAIPFREVELSPLPSPSQERGAAAAQVIAQASLPSDRDVAMLQAASMAATNPRFSRWWWMLAAPIAWGLYRVAHGLWGARRIIARSRVIPDPELAQLLKDLSGRLGERGSLRVYESAESAVPLCVGWWRPCIVLPADWRQWPEETLRAVLAHELSHLVRHDVAWQLLARLACAFYWFHPLAWLAARRMRIEREAACDDGVLRLGEKPTAYARVLLDIASRLSQEPTIPGAAVAMAVRTDLEQRVRAILAPDRPRSPVGRRVGRILALGTLTILLTAAALSPWSPVPVEPLVASEDKPQVEKKPEAHAPKAETLEPEKSKLVINDKPIETAKPVATKATQSDIIIVSGHVVDEKRKAVANVSLRLHEMLAEGVLGKFTSQKTDKYGRYWIKCERPEAIQYMRLVAEDPSGQQRGSVQVNLTSKKESFDAPELALHPLQDVRVLVKDQQGHPAKGAQVLAGGSTWWTNIKATTNDQGEALLRFPGGDNLSTVLAYIPGVGLDYVHFRSRKNRDADEEDLPERERYAVVRDFSKPVTLTLNNVRSQKVRLVNDRDEPIAGATMSLMNVEIPKRGGQAGLGHNFEAITDLQGYASFSTIPVQTVGSMMISATTQAEKNDRPSAYHWWFYDPESGPVEPTFQTSSSARMKVTVKFADGRPAAGAEVTVVGAGDPKGGNVTLTETCTPEGTFEPRVSTNKFYLITARLGKEVAPAVVRTIRAGRPVPSVSLVLGPATRLHGSIVDDTRRIPAEKNGVFLKVLDGDGHHQLPPEERLPEIPNGRRDVFPYFFLKPQTRGEGEFEFFVAPGRYLLSESSESSRRAHSLPVTLNITTEPELEIALPTSSSKWRPLTGQVVLAENPKLGVSQANLRAEPIYRYSGGYRMTTDASGNFEATRSRSGTLIQATSADGQLSGIVRVAGNQAKVVVPVLPMASIHGRIVDAKTGQPVPDLKLTFGLLGNFPSDTQSVIFDEKKLTTDPAGEFTLTGLTVGWMYGLRYDSHYTSSHLWRLDNWRIQADKPGLLELGDLKYRLDPRVAELEDRFKQRVASLKKSSTVTPKPKLPVRPTAEANPPASLEVAGQIVDEQGTAMTKATLRRVETDREIEQKVDAEGRFRISLESEPGGRRALTLIAADESRSNLGIVTFDSDNEKLPDSPLRVVMRPSRAIPIMVRDKRGAPVKGALVMATGHRRMIIGRQQTDERGTTRLHVPRDAHFNAFTARAPGVGFDYVLVRSPDSPHLHLNQVPADLSGPVTLNLGDVHTLRIRVLDDRGDPVAGVRLSLASITRPDRGGALWLDSVFTAVTDKKGFASFTQIPEDQLGPISILAQIGERRLRKNPRVEQWFYQKSMGNEVTYRVTPVVSVTGTVKFADGRAASGATVRVVGSGLKDPDFEDETRCQPEGTFKIDVPVNKYYAIAASSDHFVSPNSMQVIRAGQPAKPVSLVLQPATRIFGSVTHGPERKPKPDLGVFLTLRDNNGYYQLPPDQRLPAEPAQPGFVEVQPKSISPIRSLRAKTDAKGQFEFFAAAGSYSLNGPEGLAVKRIDVTGQKEQEFNFHSEEPLQAEISGRVILATNREQGVSKANVQSVSKQPGMGWFGAVANGVGNFQSTWPPSNSLVRAWTSDGKLNGIAEIANTDKQITIPVGPPGSAHGRLVEAKTGLPIANRQIDYGVTIKFADGSSTMAFGNAVKTNALGEFTLTNLAIGWKYDVSAVIGVGADGRAQGWQMVRRIVAEKPEVTELGEIAFPPPAADGGNGKLPNQANVPKPAEIAAASPTALPRQNDSVAVTAQVVDEKGVPVPNVTLRIQEQSKSHFKILGTDGRFRMVFESTSPRRIIMLLASDASGKRQAAKQIDLQFDGKPIPEAKLVLRPAREIQVRVNSKQDIVFSGVIFANVNGQQCFPVGSTDQSGKALVHIPHDVSLDAIWTNGGGLSKLNEGGFDYVLFRHPNEPADDSKRLASDFDGPVSLTLGGVRTLQVTVIDDRDQPVPGVALIPSRFQLPKKGQWLWLQGAIQQTTDERGVARFDVPADQVGEIPFYARATDEKLNRVLRMQEWKFNPLEDQSNVTFRIAPPVTLRGTVKFADGRPCPDAAVTVIGSGYEHTHSRGDTKCAADGTFETQVKGDMYYLILARKDKFASPRVMQVVHTGRPVAPISLVMQPATRIHGTVTTGPDKQPQGGKLVMLGQYDDYSYNKVPAQDRLPEPKGTRTSPYPQEYRSMMTDAQGRFEFFAGPGLFVVNGPSGIGNPQFKLNGQAEHQVNLNSTQPLQVDAVGLIVYANNPGVGVPKANVYAASKTEMAGGFTAVTTETGEFKTTRVPTPVLVRAWTTDGRLAAIAEMSETAYSIRIPLKPTTAARGRLVDGTTGRPLAECDIEFGVQIKYPSNRWTHAFGGALKTDAQGVFTLPGLATGWKYTIRIVTEKNQRGEAFTWKEISTVQADAPGNLELGDLKFAPPRKPITPEDRISSAMSIDPAPLAKLEPKLRDAKVMEQRVLVIAMARTAPVGRQLLDIHFGAVKDTDKIYEEMQNYSLLIVDTAVGPARGAAQSLFERLKLALPADGETLFAILDDNGQVLTRAAGSDVATDGKLSSAKLSAFLKKHVLPFPDAEKLLAQALLQAKREDKRIFLRHTGAGCYPCVQLSHYLERHRELLSRDYVIVKIDDRYAHGEAVIKRFRTQEDRGIPWSVILDSDGKLLTNSTGPEGNIGFPVTPDEISQFRKMLQASARRLTAADLESLLKPLAQPPR